MSEEIEAKESPWKGRPIIIGGTVVALLLAWLLWPAGSGVNTTDLATFEVRRGPMNIHVLEGGNIHALASHEYRSEIKASSSSSMDGTKILSIIEEGYLVTEEDVKNGKVIVELDDSRLKERMLSQEIDLQTDLAAFAEADEARAIQASANQSAIKEARQAVRFAGLDFEKYIGNVASHSLLKERNLPYDVETLGAYEEALDREFDQDEDENGAPPKPDSDSITDSAAGVDFLKYIEGDDLGDGEAQQTLRKLMDDLLLAQSEQDLAEEAYEGSKRLAARNFITQTSLENELVALQKSRLRVQTAATDLEIFRKYGFPKAAEELLSDYEESLLKLGRSKRTAAAQMAQADARFQSAERRYQLELKETEDLEYQLQRCVIRAEVPGLIAYGGAETNYYKSRYYDAITEGAEVRFGQPIITTPDMSQMGVTVNIHESYVKKVALGQKARITIDAEPGIDLHGTVIKLAVLPDSANMRYNPNLKVYPASVKIDESQDWLKPGMSAKVEIVVDEIEDTLYVPVQSVFAQATDHFCYVAGGGKVEKRRVVVGSFNDEFIQITSGLDEGEIVFLSEPSGFDSEDPEVVPAPAEGKELAGN